MANDNNKLAKAVVQYASENKMQLFNIEKDKIEKFFNVSQPDSTTNNKMQEQNEK